MIFLFPDQPKTRYCVERTFYMWLELFIFIFPDLFTCDWNSYMWLELFICDWNFLYVIGTFYIFICYNNRNVSHSDWMCFSSFRATFFYIFFIYFLFFTCNGVSSSPPCPPPWPLTPDSPGRTQGSWGGFVLNVTCA